MNSILHFLDGIIQVLQTIGLTAFILCVAFAGLMRMVSGGNERRITMSNMALTAAVVGIAITLLAVAFRDIVMPLLPGAGVPGGQ